jgi:serine phosphatase RsbU (regulator of sigma subunit)
VLANGTRQDLGEALAALARAGRDLAAGVALDPVLGELTRAAAVGADADVAVAWLPQGETLAARSVWAASSSLAAELEGLASPALDRAAELVRRRLGESATVHTLPFAAADGEGALVLARRGGAFESDGEPIAALAADLAGLAARLCADGATQRAEPAGTVEIAGEALAAVAGEEGAAARIARLGALAAGAEAALVWRVRGGRVELDGAHGAIVPGAQLERAAQLALSAPSGVAVDADGGRALVTLQLGQPAFGALQLRFAGSRAPEQRRLESLASFAVRAAHALRSFERARDAGNELERSRALIAVVGDAIAHLSLSHTLETAIERLGDLLGTDRIAVYLREDGRITTAASRGVDGPHEAIAGALLAAALDARREGGIVEIEDAAADERLAAVRAQAQEADVDSALALGLVVQDQPIGVLAVYPREPRPLTENERALLSALAAQLAIAVENARLHEQATALGQAREHALEAERDARRRLEAQYAISRSFAHSLSLERTLDELAKAMVTLLGVDACVIRTPDERGLELVARAIHVDDDRIDAAARALLGRPQPLPRRELLALLSRDEPLLLDAEQAEALGGAFALLAPFLRRGSTAAVIPIATPAELLATMTLVSLHPRRPVAGEVAETALAVAGQAALAIDNARLYGQQKAFADTMQRALLPRETPEIPGLEVGAVYESAARVEVGGDVYDYVTLDDGRLAVVLGDVTGHGVDATADMAMAKYVFRSLARDHDDPGSFLAAANDVIASEIAPGRFITMAALVVDVEKGEVACASAGHPPPRLVLPDGTVQGIAAGGLALGIDAPQTYETQVHAFPPGAIAVAYTDGVIEARNEGEQFGVDKLDGLLSITQELAPRDIARAALDACRDWTGGELTDDFAIVAVKRVETT